MGEMAEYYASHEHLEETRVFFAHSIQHAFDEIKPLMARCRASMQASWPDKYLTFTSGRDDWQRRMPIMGGWDAWKPSVSGELADGTPRYHIFVVPVGVHGVGTATVDILVGARAKGREIYRWHEVQDAFGSW